MLYELRNQVQGLSHQNSSLKGKVQFFKTLHEAESRKRSPYTHIPPRVVTGVRRKQIIEKEELEISQEQENESTSELQELVNHLRFRLEDTEKMLDEFKSNDDHHKKLLEEAQRGHDVDMLTLQHENNSLKKRLMEQRKLYDDIEDSQKALFLEHKEIIITTQALGADLETEREKSMQLLKQLSDEKLKNETNRELQIIIDDVQREKTVLEEELQKMVDNKFATSRDDEYQLQISTLKNRIAELQNQHSSHLQEKIDLHKSIDDLKELVKQLTSDKQVTESRQYELQNELELLRHRFKTYEGISSDDLEEAMALLQLKHEAGVTLEFLSNIGSITDDKKRIHDLKQQYALCAQDLAKTTQLLRLQESITNGFKHEIAQLKQKMKLVQNEYEFRLEEYSRLADVRGHKIEVLEREMSLMAIAPPKTLDSIIHRKISLKPGQNHLAIHIQGAIFSPQGLEYLAKRNEITQDQPLFTTCAIIDFSEFETEISCIGFGSKPIYDYTSRFVVTVDDFFLKYLQSTSVPITIYHTNGMDARPIGYSLANFQEIVTMDSKSFTYVSDILSNERTVIGKLEYRLDIEISMPMAIRAFHERSTALNLISKSNLELNDIPIIAEGSTNNLNIKLLRGTFTDTMDNEEDISLIFGTIHFEAFWRSVIIPPSKSSNPEFNFTTTVPLKMTSDLDRQLRTGKLLIAFADDLSDWIYGYVKIPLLELALGHDISGSFDVQDVKGLICGKVDLEIGWESIYSIAAIPNVFDI